MRKQWLMVTAAALSAGFVFGVLYSPGPVGAASKEMIQLQQDITRLVEGQRALESSIDQKHAVLKTLIEQTLDSNNKLSTAMASLKQSMQESQAGSGSRVDTLATQVQALVDNIEEVKSRLNKLNQQAADTQSVLQNLDAKMGGGAPGMGAGPGGMANPGAGPGTAAAPPSADVLYSNALRDYGSGKNDMARAEFLDYLKFFPDNDLASNAQFYLGEILYMQKQYADAVVEYDKVLQNYPRSFKLAGAQLKKGLSLIELGRKASGMRELHEVIRRHPGTEEAKRAAAKLREIGSR
ncbi:MAG: tetratricopeptide repeat protein [Acidipila sp.]|nr:tetratricopeptide repeat protein [Acidipila sp.]